MEDIIEKKLETMLRNIKSTGQKVTNETRQYLTNVVYKFNSNKYSTVTAGADCGDCDCKCDCSPSDCVCDCGGYCIDPNLNSL